MEFTTPQIIGKRLDISEKTVIRLIQSGELKGLKIGRRWKIPEKAYEEYLQNAFYQPDN